MASETGSRAAELFKAVLGMDGTDRAAFFESRCGGDSDLRREVESLLAADAAADQFLEEPPIVVRALGPVDSDPLIGCTIGGYRIVRPIASGGMGTVFEATHERLGRTVALKIVRTGFASPSAMRRFEYEARLLARLRHPAIAQIYEVGTHAMPGGSVPYFAMELVPNARTILEYASQRQLPTGRRLELFAEVCDAVHYGHQRGVIHRDLKPGNILVGEDTPPSSGSGDAVAIPKVIDFGVARAIDSDQALISLHTTYGQLVGTLQYMSPEQCGPDSQDLDIRSDIYSLGLVLYELLAGRPPYQLKSKDLVDATRVIREHPPAPLSSIDRMLRGDLDTIVGKALEKDRARRYQSVGHMSDDIRRHLRHEPISARPASMAYQLRTFARRNKAMVAGMAAVFGVFAIGIATTSWQAVRARRSEHQARESLRNSLIAQAGARRQTLTAGRRTESLEALSRAAAIRRGVDIRNEVISTLAVPEFRHRPVPFPPGSSAVFFSDDLSQCAASMADGGAIIVRIPDGAEVARIPRPSVTVVRVTRSYCDSHHFIRAIEQQDRLQRIESWRIPEALLEWSVADIPRGDEFDVSPDGRTLAVGRGDRAIHLLDVATGQETRRIGVDDNARHLRFDRSGKRLARYDDDPGEVSIVDIESGTTTRAFDDCQISFAVAWSPDGRLLAGAQRDLIHLWDVPRRREIAVLRGHGSQVTDLSFSHDGRVLTSDGWDGTPIIWDLTTLRPILQSDLCRMKFSPDDRMIGGLAASDGTLRAFVGAFLYRDQYRTISEQFGTDAIRGISFTLHPRGRVAVASITDRVKKSDGLLFFDVARGCTVERMDCGSIEKIRFDSSGSHLYTTGERGLLEWRVSIDQSNLHVGPPQQLLADSQAEQFDLSTDGKRLAIVSWGKRTLTIIDTDHPDQRATHNVLPKGLSVALSPDGKWAAVTTWHASGGEVWDVDAGAVVARLDIPNATPAFSPDGRWLTIREWTCIRFLRVGDWKEVHRFDVLMGTRVGFSPDGRILACGDHRNAVHLFDTTKLEELAVFESPDLFTLADTPCISNDGRLVVFTTQGAMLQIWDMPRIRSTLASMGLDWDHPPILPAAPIGPANALRLDADPGPAPNSRAARR